MDENTRALRVEILLQKLKNIGLGYPIKTRHSVHGNPLIPVSMPYVLQSFLPIKTANERFL